MLRMKRRSGKRVKEFTNDMKDRYESLRGTGHRELW